MVNSSSISKFCAKHIALYKNFIIYCILALITTFVYWHSLSYPFQFDDLPNIVNYINLKKTSLNALFFAQSRWIGITLNYFLYQYFQSDPFICRLVNLIIHLINGGLVFTLISKFKLKNFPINYLTIITTLFFLLHPVQTQTICYIIQGQLEGLASLFTLAAILIFYDYVKTHQIFLKFFKFLILLFFLLLATGTKEIAIALPALILLTDWFWLARGDLQTLKQRAWLHSILLITTVIIYFYYLKPAFFWKLFTLQQTVVCNDGNVLAANTNLISQYHFLISQFKVILHYFTIFIWPFNLCVEYDWQLCSSLWAIDCWLPCLILIILGFLIFYLLKKNRTSPIAFGLLWFLICVLPRSSVIASGELLVDYKTYLASIGWLFVLAYIISLIGSVFRTKIENNVSKNVTLIYQIFSLVLIVLLSFFTIKRQHVWSSTRAFWQDVITKAPQKARGFNNYGMTLVEAGLYDQAIFYFKQAIILNKSSETKNIYWDPYKNLANAYAMTNRIDLAIEIIKQGLLIYPENASLHNNLGALLLHQHDYLNSIQHLQIALKINPKLEQALYTLGKAYLMTNQPNLAWQILRQGCLETHLDRNPAALELYAQASIQTQNFQDAIWALQKLVVLQPNHLMALFNLGSVHYFMKDIPTAIKCYEQILLIEPNHQAAQAKIKLLLEH